ncbi:MAG: HEPN domain-containing protein [Candidatus Margulisiibacteriota bacterium]
MEDSIVLASTYRLVAVNFWESAKKLENTMEKREDGSPAKLTAIPFYFLVSQAVELFLKAALLKRGWEERNLKKYDYRHNLKALLGELQKKDILITDETQTIVKGLSSQYSSHALRYKFFTNPYMPAPHLIHPMLEELLLVTRISTQGR